MSRAPWPTSRLLTGLALALAAVAVTALASLPGQPAGVAGQEAAAGVRVSTDRGEYEPGEGVEVTVANGGAARVTTGAGSQCSALRLERRVGDGWTELPRPATACPAIARLLDPGGRFTETIPGAPEPGTYRAGFVFTVEGGGAQQTSYSAPYTVRGATPAPTPAASPSPTPTATPLPSPATTPGASPAASPAPSPAPSASPSPRPPTPAPLPSPQSVTLAAGARATLRVAARPADLVVTVTNGSTGSAYVTLAIPRLTNLAQQPGTLTIEGIEGSVLQVLRSDDLHRPPGAGVPCSVPDGRPHALTCAVTAGATLTFGTLPPGVAVNVRADNDRYAHGDLLTATIENAGTVRTSASNHTCGGLRLQRLAGQNWEELPVLSRPGAPSGVVACQPVLLTLEPGESRTEEIALDVEPGAYRLTHAFNVDGVESRLTVYSSPFRVGATAEVRTLTALTCGGPESGVLTPARQPITARLTQEDGTPLPNRELRWTLVQPAPSGLGPATSLTNDDGIAATAYLLPFDANVDREITVQAAFAGDAGFEPARCEITLPARSGRFGPAPSPTPGPPSSPAPSPMPSPVSSPMPARTATRLTCAGPQGGSTEDGVITPANGRLTATLTDEAGAPLPNREIRWTSDPPAASFGLSTSSRTNAEGVASTTYLIPFDAGIDREVRIITAFPGDDTLAPTECQIQARLVSPGLPTPPPRPAPSPGP